MRLVSFHDWIRHIYATHDDELDCDQAFDLLAPCVDAVVAGEATSSCFGPLVHHLRQCPHCTELFLGMRDAARLESESSEPSVVTVERRSNL